LNSYCTERFTDLEKLNLVQFAFVDLVLGLSKFSQLPQLPQKDACFIRLNMWHTLYKMFPYQNIEWEGFSVPVQAKMKRLLKFPPASVLA